jgi:hypothetical protein
MTFKMKKKIQLKKNIENTANAFNLNDQQQRTLNKKKMIKIHISFNIIKISNKQQFQNYLKHATFQILLVINQTFRITSTGLFKSVIENFVENWKKESGRLACIMKVFC